MQAYSAYPALPDNLAAELPVIIQVGLLFLPVLAAALLQLFPFGTVLVAALAVSRAMITAGDHSETLLPDSTRQPPFFYFSGFQYTGKILWLLPDFCKGTVKIL